MLLYCETIGDTICIIISRTHDAHVIAQSGKVIQKQYFIYGQSQNDVFFQ